MDYEVEPPQKKMKTNPSPPSFLSLPEDIVVNCLARISKSYYPKLSLVCKTFSSLILSMELYMARLNLDNHENVLHVYLQLPTSRLPTSFSLWIKPNQTLTNDVWKKKNKPKGNTLLVPIPSSYSPRVPIFVAEIGSEFYAISKSNTPSSGFWVRYKSIYAWRKAPSMMVARANAIVCVLDGKIYVMGGCGTHESTYWAEVFDSKTQTWEPLPDPGTELRLSSVKTLEVIEGKIYVKSSERMDYVYDPEEGKWDVEAKSYVVESRCVIEDVWYCCGRKSCLWYDTKASKWRVVKGLATLNRYRRCDFVEVANYGGKLLIMWEKYENPHRQNKNIWCALIAFERRKDNEVRGKVEWASVVLTVPNSYVFLRSEVKPV